MQLRRRQILLMAALSVPCTNAAAITGLVHVDSGNADFINVDFPIDAFESNENQVRITAKGVFERTEVAFRVLLERTVPFVRGKNSELKMAPIKVTFESLGKESDAFLNLYGHMLGQPARNLVMRADVRADAMGLAQDFIELERRRTEMKLFFSTDDLDHYAELYLNIDRPRGVLQLAEKDPEYRTNVIRALAAPR